MPDISILCQKVAVIDKGKKIFDGTFEDLKQSAQTEGYLKTLVEELNKDVSVEA
jgi:ABC-type uncharacterized transport system ATPase subunit